MTNETKEQKPKAQILFGIRPPKNWQLNSVLQEDPEYQKLRDAWDKETNPEAKEQKRQEALIYRAKVRKENNLLEGE